MEVGVESGMIWRVGTREPGKLEYVGDGEG